jgi:hypothetical protein
MSPVFLVRSLANVPTIHPNYLGTYGRVGQYTAQCVHAFILFRQLADRADELLPLPTHYPGNRRSKRQDKATRDRRPRTAKQCLNDLNYRLHYQHTYTGYIHPYLLTYRLIKRASK